MREAFSNDLAYPPDWAVDPATSPSNLTVLLVEDDPEQRAVVGAYLRAAGYGVQEPGAGDHVIDHVRAHWPSVVLLDIEMPGLNGFSVCRLLEADPELSAIPVIISHHAGRARRSDDGLTLGADEFLPKAVDLRELLVRIQRLAGRTAAAAESRAAADLLSYPAFVAAARGPLSTGPEAVALVRVLPDDDPEVARIVDAHMRVDGFSTTIAFDGQQALEAVEREQPDVLMLDLMMPKMTGFDVLHRMRALAQKPRVIVLSARGREQDVTRAFDLGRTIT
jgi:DNA-binding response OmpR family regulator